jgi:cellulose synthase/poly-beta-1,6-N-acetylglucosamine synthase-like glycosyltransferase
MKTVTIALTCKNNISTIKKCVESLISQKYPKKLFKIFVVDSFSTDGTFEMLLHFAGKKQIRLVQLESNIAKAHNYIINNSKTDLIAFTDADCVVDNNWLYELTLPFKQKNIGATGGLMRTPEDVNGLQKAIGMELESRTIKFPDFITRAPTANLCVRTKIAKEVMFDESFDVAQETDFCYRLTKKYSMKYVPRAIVYHYHRASWGSYFKQQYRYGRMMPKLYLRHKEKSGGDSISTANMAASVVYMYFFFLSFLLFAINVYFPMIFVATILFSIYLTDIMKIKNAKGNYLNLFEIFFVRNVAWNIGILVGAICYR